MRGFVGAVVVVAGLVACQALFAGLIGGAFFALKASCESCADDVMIVFVVGTGALALTIAIIRKSVMLIGVTRKRVPR